MKTTYGLLLRSLLIIMTIFSVIILFSCSDSSPTKPLNIEPICSFTHPESQSIFYIGEDIEVIAVADDEDGSITEVVFQINDDIIHNDSEAPYTFFLNTTDYLAGDYYLTSFAKDTDGEQSIIDSITVKIRNSAPIAEINVNQNSGSIVTLFEFDASNSDDLQDPLSDLEVRWDFNGDSVYDTEWSYDKTNSYQYESYGTFNCALEVRDTEGLTDTSQVVIVVENSEPIASFISSQTFGSTGSIFEFDGSTSSDNEDPSATLEIRWDFDGDGVYDTDWSNEKIVVHHFQNENTYRVRMEVKDSEGLTDHVENIVLVLNVGELIPVPAGSFVMGSDEIGGKSSPAHNVTLTNEYQMGKFEVTNLQFCTIMNYALLNDLIYVEEEYRFIVYNKDGDQKALMYEHLGAVFNSIVWDENLFTVKNGRENYGSDMMTWHGAAFYCNILSLVHGYSELYDLEDWSCNVYPDSEIGFRLPTEAEWEYAARYNDNRDYPWGNDQISTEYANYDNNFNGPMNVGSFPLGNSVLGFCDMAGNVDELCTDRYEEYSGAAQVNPVGSGFDSDVIVRGGASGGSHENSWKSACRDANYFFNGHNGCRIVLIDL